MPWFSARAGPPTPRESAAGGVAFRFRGQRRHPDLCDYEAPWPGLHVPIPTLRRCLHEHRRTVQGRRGSLLLRRRALPSPPRCRFFPALLRACYRAWLDMPDRRSLASVHPRVRHEPARVPPVDGRANWVPDTKRAARMRPPRGRSSTGVGNHAAQRLHRSADSRLCRGLGRSRPERYGRACAVRCRPAPGMRRRVRTQPTEIGARIISATERA